MKIKLSSFAAVLITAGAATAFSVGVCVTTVLLSDLSVLPWGDRVTGPRQVLPEDLREWPDGALADAADAAAPGVASAVGHERYLQSCATCHGVKGQGMPHQGPSLVDSAFVAGSGDADLTTFLRRGRLPNDPASVMRLYMPPRGGNPALTDDDLAEIVKHMRSLRAGTASDPAHATAAALPRPPGWTP